MRLLIFLTGAALMAQPSRIDRSSRTLIGSIDFTGAVLTKPFRTASAPSGSCTNAAEIVLAGSSIWGCISGTWTLVGGGVGTATNGQVLVNSSGAVAGLDTSGSGSVARVQSPVFLGTPTAPTQTAGDNSTKVATTAYADAIAALKANIASPALTGDPTAPTPATSDNDTSIATTAHVKAAIDDKTLAFVSGDALKIGRVNAAGNSTEWEYPASRVAPITFSNPGNTITTGWCQVRYLPRGGRIGSIHFASLNPTNGAAVTGSASITFEVSADTGSPSYSSIGTSGITSASQAKDTTLSGFTATIPANRILRACVASATSVQHLVVSPEVW